MIWKKLSTTLKMSSYIHTSLMDQAEEFRSTYQIQSGTNGSQKEKTLIDEEWSEFDEAYRFCGKNAQLKELADLVYVCFQFAASQEWDLEEAMRRVHRSNMSKLGEDGKPIYREDGKVLKGPNYQPPNLTDLV